jgi:hypothetical protein
MTTHSRIAPAAISTPHRVLVRKGVAINPDQIETVTQGGDDEPFCWLLTAGGRMLTVSGTLDEVLAKLGWSPVATMDSEVLHCRHSFCTGILTTADDSCAFRCLTCNRHYVIIDTPKGEQLGYVSGCADEGNEWSTNPMAIQLQPHPYIESDDNRGCAFQLIDPTTTSGFSRCGALYDAELHKVDHGFNKSSR